MPSQRQVRGTTQATQESRTLTSREVDVNTTDTRICVHDGSTAGGVPHVNWKDEINQEFTCAAASGTDAITISLAKAPAAYAANQRFVFKAAATNTGSATLNVNSLGAKTIKKKDGATGSITTLAAGDIIIGGYYAVYYDGTDMILESVDSGGLASVSQGDLNTSTGTISTTAPSITSGSSNISKSSGEVSLPGGAYGFTIESRDCQNAAGGTTCWVHNETSSTYNASVCALSILENGASGSIGGTTIRAQQTYITSSPPFDLGDGELQGFVFARLDKQGNVLSTYIADVPPWAYNGPTKTRADKVCRLTGKKYRRVCNDPTLEQIMDGAPPEYFYEEITQEIKNRDMGIIPHPFGRVGPDETVVLLDPMCPKIGNLIAYQNAGYDHGFELAMHDGRIRIDNDGLKRAGPRGVMCVRYIF